MQAQWSTQLMEQWYPQADQLLTQVYSLPWEELALECNVLVEQLRVVVEQHKDDTDETWTDLCTILKDHARVLNWFSRPASHQTDEKQDRNSVRQCLQHFKDDLSFLYHHAFFQNQLLMRDDLDPQRMLPEPNRTVMFF